ncbi:MAG: hypothetical protein U0L51_07140 [Olegusella sp.]|nr:hypothetical protein [Olegusella sp.]
MGKILFSIILIRIIIRKCKGNRNILACKAGAACEHIGVISGRVGCPCVEPHKAREALATVEHIGVARDTAGIELPPVLLFYDKGDEVPVALEPGFKTLNFNPRVHNERRDLVLIDHRLPG